MSRLSSAPNLRGKSALLETPDLTLLPSARSLTFAQCFALFFSDFRAKARLFES